MVISGPITTTQCAFYLSFREHKAHTKNPSLETFDAHIQTGMHIYIQMATAIYPKHESQKERLEHLQPLSAYYDL